MAVGALEILKACACISHRISDYSAGNKHTYVI